MTDTVVFLNISHHIPVAGRHGMQTTVFSVKIGHFALTTTLSTNLSVRFWDATTTSRYLRFLFSSRGHLKCLKEQPMLFPPVRRSLCVCFDNRVETIVFSCCLLKFGRCGWNPHPTWVRLEEVHSTTRQTRNSTVHVWSPGSALKEVIWWPSRWHFKSAQAE